MTNDDTPDMYDRQPYDLPEPAESFKPGDRVTHRENAALGSGTVLQYGYEGAGVRVLWDIERSPGLSHPVYLPDQLTHDAALPDAKLALARALQYRRTRDRLMADAWASADDRATLELEKGRAYSIAAEMAARYDQEFRAHERARATLALSDAQAAFNKRLFLRVALRLKGIDAEMARALRDYANNGDLLDWMTDASSDDTSIHDD